MSKIQGKDPCLLQRDSTTTRERQYSCVSRKPHVTQSAERTYVTTAPQLRLYTRCTQDNFRKSMMTYRENKVLTTVGWGSQPTSGTVQVRRKRSMPLVHYRIQINEQRHLRCTGCLCGACCVPAENRGVIQPMHRQLVVLRTTVSLGAVSSNYGKEPMRSCQHRELNVFGVHNDCYRMHWRHSTHETGQHHI